MIVIKASGRADVRTLRKLADQLSAGPVDQASAAAIEEVVSETREPPRRNLRPNADPRSAAIVAPAIHATIMQFSRADDGIGRYET